MSLYETIDQDLKNAMKSGDDAGKRTLRSIKSAVSIQEKLQDNQPLSDEAYVEVIRKLAKQRRDSIEAYEQAQRQDLVAEEQEELVVLERYLPALMDAEAVRQHAEKVILELGATSMRDMGTVMGRMMADLRGQADGRLVNQVVRQLLAERQT